MKAILNVYKDCQSEEPTKQYTCQRLLLGVSKKIESLQVKMQNADAKEQEELIIEILKAIFPNFEEEDFNYIDPVEYLEFCQCLTNESNKIVSNAQKN